jgi:hypothetical protein
MPEAEHLLKFGCQLLNELIGTNLARLSQLSGVQIFLEKAQTELYLTLVETNIE